MQDNTQQTPVVDPMAAATTTTTPAADVTMTPMPAADVTTTSMPAVDANTTVVTETPAPMATEPTVMDATQVGPAPVEVPEIKVELPEVPAPATPVATETPVTPTV